MTIEQTVMAAGAAGWVTSKLAGPTLDLFGEILRAKIEERPFVKRIIENARRKEETHRTNSKGAIPVRVVKEIINEGTFCEDELMAEYYGGILAASVSSEGKDDRRIPLLSTIKELSSFQLKFHYAAYVTMNHLFHGEAFNLGMGSDCRKMRTFISHSAYLNLFSLEDKEDAEHLLGQILYGLHRHDLIGNFSSGPMEEFCLQNDFHGYSHLKGRAIILEPTFFGAELLLAAEGFQKLTATNFLSVKINGDEKTMWPIADGKTGEPYCQAIPLIARTPEPTRTRRSELN